MAIKGITKRWLYNSLGLILIILIVLVVAFAFIVRGYFYSGIQQTINGRSNELANIFSGYTGRSSSEFTTDARSYVEDFPDKELMELMIFDNTDKLIITSTGFEPDPQQKMPDYKIAKSSSTHYGSWTGKLSSGEECMAVTRGIYSSNGEYVGAIRYVVSLSAANNRIFLSVLLLFSAGIVVVFFVILSSSYFIKSIVNPVREIGTTAKRIAQGDFRARIDKQYDDEIGELCDTINDMAEELGVAEKLKNDFISSVSHELRTPLTAIKGWAETMEMSGTMDPVTMEKGMKIIVSETERLSGIVEELLDFSRMQNGRMVLMMDKIDLLAELDEAVYMFKDRAASEKKNLLYEEPEIVSPVLGDRNRLRQVFINIIDNALKYTNEQGTVLIKVTEEDGKISIVVTDNGDGISETDLPRVKDKFYKANQTRRGSGIGLAIADEIVKLHSGVLEIASEEGIGTVVTISIPVIQEEKKKDQQPEYEKGDVQ